METLRILVIDDEENMRMAIERVLSKHTFVCAEVQHDVGFTVQQAGSGEDGLKICEEAIPDILLLDQKLPGISGLEVLERISPRAPDMLTVMITAYASIEAAVRATKQGAYDFLPKPFTPAELKYVVQKAAGRILLARSARRLAEEKKRIRFEFIRVLGHELKAPLGAVSNYLSLLKKQTLGAELKAYEEVVDRSQVRLEQMQKLVADLLDMTRIESGQRARELLELDIVEVARRSLELIEPQAQPRGISIRLEAPPTLALRADRTEMEMIFNNLISNAVKYNRDGGSVVITLGRDPEGVLFVVSDTGIGMSTEESARLFGEFVRIKNEKTVRILGSGLGLSIVKRLVELNNGTISVESAPDVGTTFTIRLKNA